DSAIPRTGKPARAAGARTIRTDQPACQRSVRVGACAPSWRQALIPRLAATCGAAGSTVRTMWTTGLDGTPILTAMSPGLRARADWARTPHEHARGRPIRPLGVRF